MGRGGGQKRQGMTDRAQGSTTRAQWGQTGRGPQTGRGGANMAFTVPLFEAVLPNCYLVLGLKDRTPSPRLDLHLASLRHPSGGLWGCPAMSLGELGVLSGWRLCWRLSLPIACHSFLMSPLHRRESKGIKSHELKTNKKTQHATVKPPPLA